MPKEDIYGRLFKSYDTKTPKTFIKEGKLSLYAFNNHTLNLLLNFSRNFSRIMNHEQVRLTKQSTTTHNIYTFYEDKKKTKTYAILQDKERSIDNNKCELNINDPYLFRIAHHEKIIQFKKRYVAVSNTIKNLDGSEVRLELNLYNMKIYRCIRTQHGQPFRQEETIFQQQAQVQFTKKNPRYSYEHFITELRGNPDIINKSARNLAKQFGTTERTIRYWKARFKAAITY